MSGMQQTQIGPARTPVSRRLGIYAMGVAIGLMVVGFASQRRQAGSQPPATPTDEATQSAQLAERLEAAAADAPAERAPGEPLPQR